MGTVSLQENTIICGLRIYAFLFLHFLQIIFFKVLLVIVITAHFEKNLIASFHARLTVTLPTLLFTSL